MQKLKKLVKDFLYSRHSPEFLSNWYFQKKDAGNRAKLARFLAEKRDLLEAVGERAKTHWIPRIQLVLSAGDNAYIPRHEAAGTIQHGNLILHNGIQIDPLSYYSFPMMKMLLDNKGVHEPQEERIFQEVLKDLDGSKKLTMIELGAYWSFYSMWLLSTFPTASCLMVEPDKKNLMYGKRNFKLNNLEGTFVHAGIGKDQQAGQFNTSVDVLCMEHNIDFLDVLHADIQGFELEMLQGSKSMLDQNKIGYVFISTHSNQLHHDCRAFLRPYNFIEVASVDLDESFSWDGILVMRAPSYPGLEQVEVIKKSKS